MNASPALSFNPLFPPSPTLRVRQLIMIACFDLLGRFCRTLAVQQEQVPDAASLVALVSVLEIPFTYFWGWLFAGQNMEVINLIGAIVVVSSVILLSVPGLWKEDNDDDDHDDGEQRALVTENRRKVSGEGEGGGQGE